eukprot:5698081-Pyramimonas_sp.AAC.1
MEIHRGMSVADYFNVGRNEPDDEENVKHFSNSLKELVAAIRAHDVPTVKVTIFSTSGRTHAHPMSGNAKISPSSVCTKVPRTAQQHKFRCYSRPMLSMLVNSHRATSGCPAGAIAHTLSVTGTLPSIFASQ